MVRSGYPSLLACGWLSSLPVLMGWLGGKRERESGERGRESSLVSSYKDTNPIMRTPRLPTWSKPNQLLKAPPPNTITLGG